MPRKTKRSVTEVDAIPLRSAKKTSGTELRVADLTETPIEALEATAAPAAQTSQTAVKETSDPSNSNKKTGFPCTLKFVTIPRPPFDFQLEYTNSNRKERQKAWKMLRKSCKKFWLKPAADFPDHAWKLSTKARKWNRKFDIQAQKRSQETFDLYFYNDFTGYGVHEVIENQLLAWKKEFVKGNPNPFELWAMMESFGYFFHETDNLPLWNMIDDSERVEEIFHLIGLAVLSTINILERADLFKKDSAIINIPLVLSLWLNVAANFNPSTFGDDEWPNVIRGYAAKHDIEIKGLHGIGASDDDFPVQDLPRARQTLIGKKGGADKWKFKPAYKEYAECYGHQFLFSRDLLIGGTEFDIFEMTPEERMAASFEEPKEDPLATHPEVPDEDVGTDDDSSMIGDDEDEDDSDEDEDEDDSDEDEDEDEDEDNSDDDE